MGNIVLTITYDQQRIECEWIQMLLWISWHILVVIIIIIIILL